MHRSRAGKLRCLQVSLGDDIRHSLHGLGRIPGFMAVVLLILALVGMLVNRFSEIRPLDFSSFVAAVAVFPLAALCACRLPARRTMRVDANIALRHE